MSNKQGKLSNFPILLPKNSFKAILRGEEAQIEPGKLPAWGDGAGIPLKYRQLDFTDQNA